MSNFDALCHSLRNLPTSEHLGAIEKCTGLLIEANGPSGAVIGEICDILSVDQHVLTQAQVLGFAKNTVYLMPFEHPQGIRQGCTIRSRKHSLRIPVGAELKGRILNAFGQTIDGKGSVRCQEQATLHPPGINPLHRQPISEILTTGVHAIDSLLTLGRGQRVGIFAGSGVGKSSLLGRIASHLSADVNVIALIGERGREVEEFIRHHLGEEGLQRSILVIATADEPALMRKQAVYTATAIAEYFCQQGHDVALLLDSITRFAMAQRDISLALGEPPTARGYTPSVFSLLPRLVERAGNFRTQGSISAFYTVLVEGDDFNEPIADTMRSLLDGHIVLTRPLAQRGHYPAIDILQSISRLASQLISEQETLWVRTAIDHLQRYNSARDMIEVGAYQAGSNPALDEAIHRSHQIEALLRQSEKSSLERPVLMEKLRSILETPDASR
ncbi:MAG: FliI/YscN family ATPase [Legionellaceae bacterium]|nr:FliI/YscN family ATPase [Legionellaceae bacterium]